MTEDGSRSRHGGPDMGDVTRVTTSLSDAGERADHLFREQRDANFERTSRLFAVLMIVQWAFGAAIAIAHARDVLLAVVLGGAIAAVPAYLAIARPIAPVTRHTVAIGQMLWSALLVHLTGGRIESHFHAFGSLAFLAFYRDWKVLVPATIVAVADRLVRQLVWPESVYGVDDPAWWRVLEHALWLVFEAGVLIGSCLVATREMRDVARSRAAVEVISEREQGKSRALQAALDELAAAQGAKVRAEKLAAVGQLAASVGHELRNPLAAVRNANAFIARKIQKDGADPKVVQFTDLIEKELDTCAKIIGDLLDFARERPLVLAPTPLRDLVDEALALLPITKIELVNRVPADLPIPLVDKEQFRQVLINLTQNAVEAMDARGHGRVTVNADCRDRGLFVLTIEDDGPGIPDDVAASIFEPLFTTKVKGTGLGLAIVAGIVKRHHGTIAVKSKVGRGTTFTIEWAGQAPAARASSAGDATRSSAPRIDTRPR